MLSETQTAPVGLQLGLPKLRSALPSLLSLQIPPILLQLQLQGGYELRSRMPLPVLHQENTPKKI